jgi:hypothetical protein
VENGEVIINPISTEDQLADIFTKPLGKQLFEKFRYLIMGWKMAQENESLATPPKGV